MFVTENEVFENAVQGERFWKRMCSVLVWQVKTEVFENAYVIAHLMLRGKIKDRQCNISDIFVFIWFQLDC